MSFWGKKPFDGLILRRTVIKMPLPGTARVHFNCDNNVKVSECRKNAKNEFRQSQPNILSQFLDFVLQKPKTHKILDKHIIQSIILQKFLCFRKVGC